MLPSILDRAYWDAARTDAKLAAFWANVDESAASLPAVPPLPTASDFLAANRANNRGILDRHWRRDRTDFTALALYRCGRGLETDDRLLNWLWGFLTEPTWSVSAHLPNQDLPQSGVPCLDLASCEMAGMMAEMLEVLGPWMDSVSGTLSASVITEIDRRILTPYAEGFVVWWDSEMHRINNWVGVCAGSILAACESLAAQGHPRPVARERAIKGLQLFFESAFTPGGECDEGLSYWTYGVEYACYGLSRLSRTDLETHFDMERLKQVANYPSRAHLFGETFYAGNDAPLSTQAHPFVCAWFAEAVGELFLLHWGGETLKNHPLIKDWHFGQALRTLNVLQRSSIANSSLNAMTSATEPMEYDEAIRILNELDTPRSTVKTELVSSRFLPDQQAAIFSAKTEDGQFIACLGGGNNAERHNHNDLGHFLIAHDEQWIVPDFGAPHYTADFFGPKRYTYITASSRGHACPLVNGYEQREGAQAQAQVLACELESSSPQLLLELASAYPPEAGLTSWQRGLHMVAHPEALATISDRFQTGAAHTPITHVLWTLQEPELVAESEIMLVLRIGAVECEITPAPRSFVVTPHAPTELKLRAFNDRTLYHLGAVYETNEHGALHLETRFRPTAAFEAL